MNMIISPNLLTTTIYKVNRVLDALINVALEHEITDVTYDDNRFHITIKFSNGDILYGWNVNKYYAWLNTGKFNDYVWEESIPTVKTMRKLRKRLVEYAKKPHDVITYREFK